MIKQKYYTDNRTYNFEANVIFQEKRDCNFYIELDQTYFYPEGGGQPSDRGTISGIPVIDVQKIDSKVIHILKDAPNSTVVKCIIDKEHRDHFMVQHTGQHLISAILKHELDINTVSVHLGEEKTTIEIDKLELSNKEICLLEDKCYDLITANSKIMYHETDDEGIKSFNIRRESKFKGYIRLVEIENYDCVPCGGVHLSNLHEIGIIKVTGMDKIRGHLRINFLIGKKAFKDYRLKNSIILKLNKQLSTKDSEILDSIEKLNRTITNLKVERKSILSNYSSQIVSKILTNNPGILSLEELPVDLLQNISKALCNKIDKPILIIGVNERLNWFLVDSKDKTIDFNKFKETCLVPNNFKGGGKSPVWQGSGDKSNLASFIESTTSLIEN